MRAVLKELIDIRANSTAGAQRIRQIDDLIQRGYNAYTNGDYDTVPLMAEIEKMMPDS